MMTLAIPTGRLGDQALQLLKKAQFLDAEFEPKRQLRVTTPFFQLIFVKPSDVVTYVESGQADLGIVGSDVILETSPMIIEYLDLGIGRCQMMMAARPNFNPLDPPEILRVATKYPTITSTYFAEKNQKIELIPLKGSVELAPLIDLSEVIVDITETGRTLQENGLSIVETLFTISARLIIHEPSFYLKKAAIESFSQGLIEVIV